MTFDICLHEEFVRVGGRAGVRYVIPKFSRMDSLPNFLTHGAPLRARDELRYHGKSWVNPLTSVLSRGKSQAPVVFTDQPVSHRASKAPAQIKFLTMVENTLRSGTILTIAKLQKGYESILEANTVENQHAQKK